MFYVHMPQDIDSILVATAAEKELLESIGMGKESCWADDNDDAAVDRWTKIIQKGRNKFSLKNSSASILGLVQLWLKIPPVLLLEDHPIMQNLVRLMQIRWRLMDRALKAMEGRLMNAIRDAMKEVNKKLISLSNQLTLLEDKVKSLGDKASEEDVGDKESEEDDVGHKESEKEDGGGKESEVEDGGDKESEEDDGGDKDSEEDVDDTVLHIANLVQSEHGNGDDDMDDTAEMSAAAVQLESKMSEKANSEKANRMEKKKRARKDDGEEVVPSKKPNNVIPIGTRSQMEEQAAQKEAAPKRTRGAQQKAGEKKQKESAQKKTAHKSITPREKTVGKKQKTKKGGKKTV